MSNKRPKPNWDYEDPFCALDAHDPTTFKAMINSGEWDINFKRKKDYNFMHHMIRLVKIPSNWTFYESYDMVLFMKNKGINHNLQYPVPQQCCSLAKIMRYLKFRVKLKGSNSLLTNAILTGNLDNVEYQLTYKYGCHPFLQAIQAGQLQIVKFLTQHYGITLGTTHTIMGWHGIRTLHIVDSAVKIALRLDLCHIVRWLLFKFKMNLSNDHIFYYLNANVLKWLLRKNYLSSFLKYTDDEIFCICRKLMKSGDTTLNLQNSHVGNYACLFVAQAINGHRLFLYSKDMLEITCVNLADNPRIGPEGFKHLTDGMTKTTTLLKKLILSNVPIVSYNQLHEAAKTAKIEFICEFPTLLTIALDCIVKKCI